jgi:acetyl-CoA carboxylase biotin carboxyl carrier protein
MSTEKMTYQDLLQIVELIKSASHFGQFRLKTDDLEVELGRGADGASPMRLMPSRELPAPPSHDVGGAAPANQEARTQQRHGHIGAGEIAVEPVAAVPERATASPRLASAAYSAGAILIKSPMVGTFYRAPEPGAAPFVEVGQQVEASATVCVIEVMKLINSIPAGQPGVVIDVLVQDGEPVEFGQLLMVIDPTQ